MDSFTYSNARQNLSRLLDIAQKQGEVRIRRRDGTNFVIRPEKGKRAKSPFDIKGVHIDGITREDILEAIKEGRKDYGRPG